tara:strand:- start:2448 stop:9002 length:6555 start_codon:yes stop_codon:yes gene_type:complete
MSAIKINGTWQRVSSVKIKKEGVWIDHTALYARLEGAWHLIDLGAEAKGPAYHVWKAYADDAYGVGISLDPTDKKYLGFATGQTVEEPNLSDPTIFDWSLIKGSDGVDGTDVDESVLNDILDKQDKFPNLVTDAEGRINTAVEAQKAAIGALDKEIKATDVAFKAADTKLTTGLAGAKTSIDSTIFELGGVKDEVTGLTTLTSGHESRIINLDKLSDEQAQKVKILETSDGNSKSRIASLETTTGKTTTQLNSLGVWDGFNFSTITEVKEASAAHAKSISELETSDGATTSRVTKLEETDATHATRLTGVETSAAESKSKVATLETTTAAQAKRISTAETKGAATESKVTALETTTEDTALRVTDVETKATLVDGKASTAQKAADAADAKAVAAGKSVTTVSNRVGTLEKTGVDNASRLTNVETKSTTAVTNAATAQAKADKGVQDAAAAKKAADAAQGTADTATDTITTVTNRVGTLEETSLDSASRLTNVETTSSTAVTNAATAQTQADKGVANAAAAKKAADKGIADAAAAKAVADGAVLSISTVKNRVGTLEETSLDSASRISTVETVSSTAVADAAAAQLEAEKGIADAAAAQTKADKGVADAAAAQLKANTGVTNSAAAQATAAKGVADAAAAKKAADKGIADAKAAKAAADANALSVSTVTNRVGSLEATSLDSAKRITTVETTSTTAVKNAATAQAKADLGVKNAATAQAKANTGVANAAKAQTQADKGVANAAAAKAVADAATVSLTKVNNRVGTLEETSLDSASRLTTVETTSSTAVTSAAAAQAKADKGVLDAAAAKAQADKGVKDAATAQAKANTGVANAAKAQTQANKGVTDAVAAKVAGDKGIADAAKAKVAADAAQDAADDAALSVTEVTNRVGTLEETSLDSASRLTTVETTSSTAVKNAATAQTQANTGVANAAAAKKAADAAQGTADEAVESVATVTNRVGTLEETSLDSASRLSTVETTSSTAVKNAATAQAKADLGVKNAATAQTQANKGVTNAAAAKKAADAAQLKANSADGKVNETTNRVSTLEETDLTHASRLSAVETKSSSTASKVTVLEKTTSDSATRIEAVNTQRGKDIAASTSTAKTYTDQITGAIKAERVIKADANGKVSGVHMIATGSGADAGGKLYFQADEIAIVPPSWNGVTELDKTKFPFYFSEDRNSMYLDEATIKKLSAEIIDSGRLVVDGLSLMTKDLSLPAGAITGDMLDASFKDGLVRVNPNATALGGTVSKEVRGVAYGTSLKLPALKSGGNAHTVNARIVAPNGNDRISGHINISLFVNGAALKFNDGSDVKKVEIEIEKKLVGGPSQYYVYVSSVNFSEQIITPARVSGTDYVYEMRVVGVHVNDTSYATQYSLSFSASEPVKASGGFITDVNWDEVKSKPAQATRWPSWGEVGGKPALALANQVLTNVPAGAKFTDTNTHRGISDSVATVNASVSASQTAVKTAYDKGVDARARADSAYNLANGKLGAGSKAVDSAKLEGQAGSFYAKASQVLTNVPAGAKFTDTNTHRAISDSVATVDAGISASLTAVKTAYDRGTAALNTANTKLAATAKAVDSAKLEGQAGSFYAKASQVLTNVPAGAKFTDTNTHRGISDSVATVSNSVSASLTAVKTAYDKGVDARARADSAYNLANGKLGAGSKAVDSAKLEGRAASSFANASHTHAGHDVVTIGHRLSVDSDGKIRANHTDFRRAGLYGIYDAVRIGHIWSMGNQYQIEPKGANFGNLYGLAYKHTNNATGGTMAGGHQMVWVANGSPKAAMGESGLWSATGITAGGEIKASGAMKAKASNGTVSRVLTHDDFLPANPPAGLENTITANWIGAGAVNAKHLQVSSVVKTGGKYTSFKVAPEAERPISLSNTDAAGNEIDPIFYVDTRGNGYFKGKLSKGTVDIESIQEEARKQINPYYLGTVAGGSQSAPAGSMASGAVSTIAAVKVLGGKVNLSWKLWASKSIRSTSGNPNYATPVWRIQIYRGNASGALVFDKNYEGTARNVQDREPGMSRFWESEYSIHIEDQFSDGNALATQAYTLKATRVSGTPTAIHRGRFEGNSPAFKQMKVGYEYTTLYYAPAGTGWGNITLHADYDKFEFLAISGSDTSKKWQGMTMIPTHQITNDVGLTSTKHFMLMNMGYDSFWKGHMSGKRTVVVSDTNSLVYRVWGVNMVEKV